MLLLFDFYLSYQLFGKCVGSRDHCIVFTLQSEGKEGAFPMVPSPSLSAADGGVSVDSSTCLLHGHLQELQCFTRLSYSDERSVPK